jgi:tetratricopeptide (TPR) repeat protein
MLVIPIFLTGCKKAEVVEDEHYKRGLSQLERYEYSLALQSFKTSINTNPSNTDSYLKSSEILQRKGDQDGALSILENGKDFVADKSQVFSALGDIYLKKRDYQNAEENYKKAVNNGAGVDEKANLAKVLVITGKHDEAQNILSQHLSQDDEHKSRLGFLLASLQAQDFDKAINTIDSLGLKLDAHYNLQQLKAELITARDSDENKIEDLMRISFVIIDSKEYPFALHLLESVIAENEYYHGGQLYSGFVNLKLEEYDKAKQFFLTANELKSSDINTHKFLAQTYLNLNEQKNSFDTYGTLTSLSPNDPEIRRDYANVLISENLLDKAVVQAQKLAELEPEPQNKLFLAQIYLDLGEFQKAYDLSRNVAESEEIETLSDTVRSQQLIIEGWSLYKIGEKSAGQEILEKSLKLSNINPYTYFYLGVIYMDTGKPVDAQTSLERAIDLDLKGEITDEAVKLLGNL